MYTIDRDSDVPLYIQIRDAIEKAVRAGELNVGDRLPSVSALARDIGVTQATVRRALQYLAEAGLTDSHVGRGTFIGDGSAIAAKEDGGERAATGPGVGSVSPGMVMTDPKISAAKRMRSGVGKALYDIISLAQRPGIIELTKGVPDPALLPADFLEEVTADVLKKGSRHLIEATDPAGMHELREAIASRYRQEGLDVSPRQVLVTNGVSQAMSLMAELALESRQALICETPCFLGIPNTFSAMGPWVETVRRDQDGPELDRLARMAGSGPRLLYVCTYVHNPTGRNISGQRIAEIADWAGKTGSVVISDEIFRDLQYQPITAPGFLGELGPEKTIIVSSLSKTVMTGLRLGWIVSSEERIAELSRLKKLMDHATPTMVQAMALSILTSGKYDELTTVMQHLYRKRMSVMEQALTKMMPDGIRWSSPEGGFSMMLELPPGYSSVALLLSAVEKGVSFLPGPLFDIDHRYVNCIRLSCAWADDNMIKEGIELLADAVTEFLRQPPGDSGLSGMGGYQ